MAAAPGDLPEAATRRFAEGAFTSGLTVPDFAACLQMGLEPVGFVQGFCVMQWQWYGMGSPYGTFGAPFQGRAGGYSESWQCPHGFVSAEHRGWGQNYEQSWIEDAWQQGFSSAYDRMIEEATSVGAHGVVGLVDASERLGDMGVLEFRVQGTAVKVEGGQPPADGRPWTTYLAGQRLAKSIEAGYAPVSIAATVASVRVWAYCVTEYLTEGSRSSWGYQVGAPRDRADVQGPHGRAPHRPPTGPVPARRRLAPRGLDDHHRARARPGRRRAPVHPAGEPGTPVQEIRPDAEPPTHGAHAVSPDRDARSRADPVDLKQEMRDAAEFLSRPAPADTAPSATHRGGRTSDLSIDEELSLHSIGWEPIQLVCGASLYSVPARGVELGTGRDHLGLERLRAGLRRRRRPHPPGVHEDGRAGRGRGPCRGGGPPAIMST